MIRKYIKKTFYRDKFNSWVNMSTLYFIAFLFPFFLYTLNKVFVTLYIIFSIKN